MHDVVGTAEFFGPKITTQFLYLQAMCGSISGHSSLVDVSFVLWCEQVKSSENWESNWLSLNLLVSRCGKRVERFLVLCLTFHKHLFFLHLIYLSFGLQFSILFFTILFFNVIFIFKFLFYSNCLLSLITFVFAFFCCLFILFFEFVGLKFSFFLDV